jgi:hypothetical protein
MDMRIRGCPIRLTKSTDDNPAKAPTETTYIVKHDNQSSPHNDVIIL